MKLLKTLWIMILIVMLPVYFAASVSYQYDKRGNLIFDGEFNYEYNSFNELFLVKENSSGVVRERFLYDALDERVIQKELFDASGNWVSTTLYPFPELRVVKNASGVFNFTSVTVDGQRIAEKQPTRTIYTHPDSLGSSSVITDEDGVILENRSQSPYGLELGGSSESVWSYEGKEKSGVTGDLDFHFRLYRPEIGKFLKPDSLLPDIYDPQQLNRYAFERSNPFKYIEVKGHSLLAIILVFAVTAMATYAASQEANKAKKRYEGTLPQTDQGDKLSDWRFINDLASFDSTAMDANALARSGGTAASKLSPWLSLGAAFSDVSLAATFNFRTMSYINSIQLSESGNHYRGIGQYIDAREYFGDRLNPDDAILSLIDRWLKQNPDKADDLKNLIEEEDDDDDHDDTDDGED